MVYTLWFDVESKRYTTEYNLKEKVKELWFDVEGKRYTTIGGGSDRTACCGLM